MLSSQFNSGYRHQLVKQPCDGGFFYTFVFHLYQNRTIFYFFVILINIFPFSAVNADKGRRDEGAYKTG